MGAFDKIKSGLLGMDVYRGDRIYLHPLKVWNRYSTRMFLPHSCSLQQGEEYRFETVDGGVAMSRYYQLVEEEEEKNQDQNYDSHDRFFSLAKLDYQRGDIQRGDRKTDYREYADNRPETAGNDQEILQAERLFPAPGPYGRQRFPRRQSMRHALGPEDHTYRASGVQEIF